MLTEIWPNSRTLIRLSDSRKTRNINTESWRMVGDQYFVMQGTIQWATLHSKIQSHNLSRGHFLKCFDSCSGDIIVSFDGCDTILSVPGQDIIGYLHIIMFLACNLTNHVHGDCFSDSKMIQNTHITFFCQFASEYFGDSRASLQLFAAYKEWMCNIYIGSDLLQLSHCQ